jgi:hypothetical protein
MVDTALALAEPQRARVEELQERIRQLQAPRLDARDLPTHPALARLLPGGALQKGSTYSVDNSLTLLMLLLAAPSAAGLWCGVVGVPEFGIEAAAGFGIALERLVLVPRPGDQWLAATAALADALSVIVTRPPRQASDASGARLSARLRKRGATMLAFGNWPQSEAILSITESAWTGIGSGYGHLTARELTVTATSRVGGRPRRTRLRLPETALPGSAFPGSAFSKPAFSKSASSGG